MTSQISSILLINGLALVGGAITVTAYKINKNTCYAAPSCDFSVPATGIKWENNWDGREPKRQQRSASASGDCADPLPVARRNIFLIRHGDYNLHGGQGNLTGLGVMQAELTGKKLCEMGYKYDTLVHSTMRRAVETGSIINKYIPHTPVSSTPLLSEGFPVQTEPPTGHSPGEEQQRCDGVRIEKAFRQYFHRADPLKEKDSFEIVVCHANVIRYFVCRAMQFPPEAWLRFDLDNCSITWLVIHPNGRVEMKRYGDSGHLPHPILTS